jgi:DNA-binding protein YbaB
MTNPRPDLSGFQALNDLAASVRPEGFTEQLLQRARVMEEVQERIRALEGVGRTDDGYVVATYTAVDGLAGLTLDPRAMRMPSEHLARAVLAVSRAAREDFEEQRRAAAAELGPTPEVDLEEAQRAIQDITESYTRGIGDMQSMVERLRGQLRP